MLVVKLVQRIQSLDWFLGMLFQLKEIKNVLFVFFIFNNQALLFWVLTFRAFIWN